MATFFWGGGLLRFGIMFVDREVKSSAGGHLILNEKRKSQTDDDTGTTVSQVTTESRDCVLHCGEPITPVEPESPGSDFWFGAGHEPEPVFI